MLFLRQFRVAPHSNSNSNLNAHWSDALPPALRSLPLFAPAAAPPLVARWFGRSESELRRALAVIGLAVNAEATGAVGEPPSVGAGGSTAVDSAVPVPSPPLSPSPSPAVHSLLFRGRRLGAAALDGLVGDALRLLSLDGAVQLPLLVAQIAAEAARLAADALRTVVAEGEGQDQVQGREGADEPAAPDSAPASAATPSPLSDSALASALIEQLSRLHVAPDDSLSPSAAFSFDLESGALRCPRLDAAALAEWGGCTGSGAAAGGGGAAGPAADDDGGAASAADGRAAIGALLFALVPHCFRQCSRAVWAALAQAAADPGRRDRAAGAEDQPAADPAASSFSPSPLAAADCPAAECPAADRPAANRPPLCPASLEGRALFLLLSAAGQSESPLAALLSADAAAAAAPAEFFAPFVAAALDDSGGGRADGGPSRGRWADGGLSRGRRAAGADQSEGAEAEPRADQSEGPAAQADPAAADDSPSWSAVSAELLRCAAAGRSVDEQQRELARLIFAR